MVLNRLLMRQKKLDSGLRFTPLTITTTSEGQTTQSDLRRLSPQPSVPAMCQCFQAAAHPHHSLYPFIPLVLPSCKTLSGSSCYTAVIWAPDFTSLFQRGRRLLRQDLLKTALNAPCQSPEVTGSVSPIVYDTSESHTFIYKPSQCKPFDGVIPIYTTVF